MGVFGSSGVVTVGIKILAIPDASINNATQSVQTAFRRMSNNVRTEFIQAFRTMEREGMRFGLVMGGLAAGFSKLGNDIIQVAAQFEQFQVKLETALGSASRGKEAFAWAVKYAAITPFNVQGVVDATTTVTAYGAEYQRVMPLVANLAAGMGKRIEETALVMSKAWSGSLNGFKSLRNEFGISTAMLIRYGAVAGQNVSIATRTAGELDRARGALQRIVEMRFGSAIERQLQTFNGQLSNLQDGFQRLAMVMGNSVLPMLTDLVKAFIAAINWIEKTPLELRAIAMAFIMCIGPITAFISALSLLGGILSGLRALNLTITGIASALGVLSAAGVPLTGAGGVFGGIVAAMGPVGLAIAALIAAVLLLGTVLWGFHSANKMRAKQLASDMQFEGEKIKETSDTFSIYSRAMENAANKTQYLGSSMNATALNAQKLRKDVKATDDAIEKMIKTAKTASANDLLNGAKMAGLSIEDIEKDKSRTKNRVDELTKFAGFVKKIREMEKFNPNLTMSDVGVISKSDKKRNPGAMSPEDVHAMDVFLQKHKLAEGGVINTAGAEKFLNQQLQLVNANLDVQNSLLEKNSIQAAAFANISQRMKDMKDYFKFSDKTESIKSYGMAMQSLAKEMAITKIKIGEAMKAVGSEIDLNKVTPENLAERLNPWSKNFVSDENIQGMIKQYLEQYGMYVDFSKKQDDKLNAQNKSSSKNIIDELTKRQTAYKQHVADQQQTGKVAEDSTKQTTLSLEQWMVQQRQKELDDLHKNIKDKKKLTDEETKAISNKAMELARAKQAAAKASTPKSTFGDQAVPAFTGAAYEKEYDAQEKLKDSTKRLAELKIEMEKKVTEAIKSEKDKRDSFSSDKKAMKKAFDDTSKELDKYKSLRDKELKSEESMQATRYMSLAMMKNLPAGHTYDNKPITANMLQELMIKGIPPEKLLDMFMASDDVRKAVLKYKNKNVDTLDNKVISLEAQKEREKFDLEQVDKRKPGIGGAQKVQSEYDKIILQQTREVNADRKALEESNLKDMEDLWGTFLTEQEDMHHNNAQAKIQDLETVKKAYEDAANAREINEVKAAKKIRDLDKDILREKKKMIQDEMNLRKDITSTLANQADHERSLLGEKLKAGEDVQGKILRQTDDILKMKMANLAIEKAQELENIGDTAEHRAMLDMKYALKRQAAIEEEKNALKAMLDEVESSGNTTRDTLMASIKEKYQGSNAGGWTNSPGMTLEQMQEEGAAFFANDQGKKKPETDKIKQMIDSLDKQIKPMEDLGINVNTLGTKMGTLTNSVVTLNNTMLGVKTPDGTAAKPTPQQVAGAIGMGRVGGPSVVPGAQPPQTVTTTSGTVPTKSTGGWTYPDDVRAQIQAQMTSFTPKTTTTMADLIKDKKFSSSEELKATLDALNSAIRDKQPNIVDTPKNEVSMKTSEIPTINGPEKKAEAPGTQPAAGTIVYASFSFDGTKGDGTEIKADAVVLAQKAAKLKQMTSSGIFRDASDPAQGVRQLST